MSKDMIVCYTQERDYPNPPLDSVEAFREDVKGAFARYQELVQDDSIYSASICQVIDSTDYDGLLSGVSDDN
jgi:hypothetical protein